MDENNHYQPRLAEASAPQGQFIQANSVATDAMTSVDSIKPAATTAAAAADRVGPPVN